MMHQVIHTTSRRETLSSIVEVSIHMLGPGVECPAESVRIAHTSATGTRVRTYTHWTQVALAFGNDVEKHWARKWLKRKARMRRKQRRGWA